MGSFIGGFYHALLSILFSLFLWETCGVLLASLLIMFAKQVGLLVYFPFFYGVYTMPVGYYLRNILHKRIPQPHSVTTPFCDIPGMVVLPIPVLRDNYAYLIWCTRTKKAAVVDPSDPDPVHDKVKSKEVKLEYILVTHKHWDHAGGSAELKSLLHPSPEVVGSTIDSPHAMTKAVDEGDVLTLGDLTIHVKHVPGHTKGHVLFEVAGTDPAAPRAVFTGDSLFCCGVGCFFEATTADLHKTFNVYHSMPPDTYLFVGHEYTELLTRQALSFDMRNDHLLNACNQVTEARRHLRATVPSTIQQEKKINPFLRIGPETFAAAVKDSKSPNYIQQEMMCSHS